MDFSAFNPSSTNSLNIASRINDVFKVIQLLRTSNPNRVDNRGWTCLHEAAAHDGIDVIKLILKHPDCRPLCETYEGHTALYLACVKECSITLIMFLLENIDGIVNYASTEMVTPLHIVSAQGREAVVQLLLEYGAIIDAEDFDGDTPLHDAAFNTQYDVVQHLLHAGAQAEKRNEADYTPLHLACFKGCLKTVKALYPFVTDINQRTGNGETPLILATQNGETEVVQFLLDKGADANIKNIDDELALQVALVHGNEEVFKILLQATDKDVINKDLVILACKPHYFSMDIMKTILESDIGSEFFNLTEDFHATFETIGGIQPIYTKNAPMNPLLHISEYLYTHSKDLFQKMFYLFLMRGPAVDALYIEECPPLVYIHYCESTNCFNDVFKILLEMDCNIDYETVEGMPDAFYASLATGGTMVCSMLQYSLACDPCQIIEFIYSAELVSRVQLNVMRQLVVMLDVRSEGLTFDRYHSFVPALKHLCRVKIRSVLRNNGVRSTKQFLKVLDLIPLPRVILNFLRYL